MLRQTLSEDGPPRHGLARSPSRQLGRYVLLDQLGRGGMGEVYRAYDPELDRMIAIKRLRFEDRPGEPARQRLQREAQVVARFSHPHVAQVFDVGVDPLSQDMFIAMELIDGGTLRAWMRRKEATGWRDVVQVFLQAGRGLMAAHARGVVHRDFKPENVLLTTERCAKVVDFGLAKPARDPRVTKASGDQVAAGPDAVASGVRRWRPTEDELPSGDLSTTLTPAGARLGTPAYMPPEQMKSQPSDPRADQYSFAVALYEGLTGSLPFAGRNAAEYAFSVIDGTVRPFPRKTGVPGRLRRAVLRALSRRADDRYPSMAPLLAELEHALERRAVRNRSVVMALGLGGLMSLGAVQWFGQPGPDSSDGCAPAVSVSDAMWSGAQRAELRLRLGSVSTPHATVVADETIAAFDRMVARWKDERINACRGALRSAPVEAQLHDQRARCLDRHMSRQRALLGVLRVPTAETAVHGVEAVQALDHELDRCAQPNAVGLVAPGANARTQPILDRARQHLALGEVDAGLATLEGLPPRSPADTTEALEYGLVRAGLERARGRLEVARDVLEHAAQASLGGAPSLLAAEWNLAYGDLLRELGDHVAMDPAYARAERLYTQQLGPEAIASIVAAGTRGHQPLARGDYRKALAIYRAAADAAARKVSATDSTRLTLDEWVVRAAAHVGRLTEAREQAIDLVQRLRSSRGAHHPRTMAMLEVLGSIRLRSGDAEGAVADLREVVEFRETEASGRRSLDRAGTMVELGVAVLAQGDDVQARAILGDARAVLRDASLPPDHPQLLRVRANLGVAQRRGGDPDSARVTLRSALDGLDAAGLANTSDAIMVRLELGALLMAEDEAVLAAQVLADGVRCAEAAGDVVAQGRLQHQLARVHDAHGDTERADRAIVAAQRALAGLPADVPWRVELERYAGSRVATSDVP